MAEDAEMEETIRVPKDRIGAVIGKKGRTRKRIEQIADVKIHVNSKTGEVTVKGKESTLPENFYNALQVIRAIGRGFDEKSALELFSDDRYLDIINLRDLLPKRNDRRRQKARIIGTGGSVRKKLETLTDTHIRVYGDTVAIIGDAEGITLAHRAIIELAGEGRPHSVVFRELELQRARRKRAKILRDLGIELED